LTRTIIRRAPALLAGLLLGATCVRAANVPQAPRGRPADVETSERLMLREGAFQPLAEATERWQYDGRRLYREGMAGTYVRVERHLKLGAFYRLQYGARHDDDWFKTPAGPWAWRNTTGRPESVLVLDATPRAELPFLPGGHWTGALKLRFERNFFNGQNSLLAAPELAWFWMDGLAPRATLFLRSETWFPLNFGETTVYEQWWYLAGLWHARPWLSLGPQLALREETWSTSAAFHEKNPRVDYRTRYRSWVPGFTVVARLP
jgi:hypothetical protein